jgi:ankyrin repeat protein
MKLYSFLMVLIMGSVIHAMNQCNVPNEEQFPIHYAAAINDREIIRIISKRQNILTLELLKQRDTLGRTPLHWAARNGYNSIVSDIVVTLQGCSKNDAVTIALLNQRDTSGKTATELANENGQDTVVDNLVYAGADDPRNNDAIIREPQQTSNVMTTTISITPEPLIFQTYNTENQSYTPSYYETFHRYVKKALLGLMMVVVIGTQFMQHNHQQTFSDLD